LPKTATPPPPPKKKKKKTWLLAFSLSFFEFCFCGDFEKGIFCCKISFLKKKSQK